MTCLSPYLFKCRWGYTHWCPACEETHVFYVDEPTRQGARWKFNGNVNKPSFVKSMNISWLDSGGKTYRCHYTITNGMIQFHTDCTHAFVGKKVPLPTLPVDRFPSVPTA